MEALKTWNTDDVLFADNQIADVEIGIGTFNAVRPIVRDNEIWNFSREGIQTKGGTRGAIVSGNYVHTANADAGIVLGGSSCGSTSTVNCGNYDPDGYENYQSVAYNNIVVSERAGEMLVALQIQGCDGCAFLNNVAVGAETGQGAYAGGGTANGWSWAVTANAPVFRNNIVVDCTWTGRDFRGAEQATADHNLYSNCGDMPGEAGAVYADPLFVAKGSDWHLQGESDARGAGVPVSFTAWGGVSIAVGVTRDGAVRTTSWNIGAY